jgi:PAS domain S-box-containing protein
MSEKHSGSGARKQVILNKVDRGGVSALKGQLARIMELYENSPDLVLILDPQGRILYANKAWRHSLGFPDSDLGHLTLFDVTRTEDHIVCEDWLRQAGGGVSEDSEFVGSSRDVELVFLGQSPRRVPVRGIARPQVRGDQILYWSGFFRDVTRQIQAEVERKEALELFRVLSAHSPVGIFRTDFQGRLLYVNKLWLELAQMPHARCPQGVWWQMVHPEDRDAVLESWASAVRHGHEFVEVFRVFTGGAPVRWVRVRLTPIQPVEDTGGSCIGTVEDITEQQLAAEILRRTHDDLERMVESRTAELQQANWDLAEFAHIVSHDLKAPLRGVGHLSEWIGRDFGDRLGPEGMEMFGLLRQRVHHMHQLIDGILAYTRVGRLKTNEVDLLLDDVLREICQAISPPPSVHIRILIDSVRLSGVREQVYQVFQNLIDNSVKFMDKVAGKVEVLAQRSDEGWQFTVRDNGPGIDPKHHERIFGIFEQLRPAGLKKSTESGSGIGLALVKRIIEGRGGRIWVESEVGEGATFHFEWPDQRVDR